MKKRFFKIIAAIVRKSIDSLLTVWLWAQKKVNGEKKR